ncbi:hypothetical protein [Planktothrix sp. PCC 11201]|uniref:hypothetical protein n=1 Tax=Planktothrix sp. PCC 11201 TaxID=1729650 RepID=UPI0009A74125|nr:hypothetical protein [Planktothrix sp. PCC 11201]
MNTQDGTENNQNLELPLLETVLNILDMSLSILEKHPNAEDDRIKQVADEITQVQEQIRQYEIDMAESMIFTTLEGERINNPERQEILNLLTFLIKYFS